MRRSAIIALTILSASLAACAFPPGNGARTQDEARYDTKYSHISRTPFTSMQSFSSR